jgi:PPOX class probable F420-dependent enzyme
MASRRGQITMTPDEVEAFLDRERTMQVASINRDGTPHLVAMWFTRHDGELAFWTYAKSQKVLNVRRDPRITVMVETGDTYDALKGVTIYGHAHIIEDRDEVFAFGDALYPRYWEGVDSDAAREQVRAMGSKRVLITIERERTISWDHTKLGGTY